MLRPFPFPVPVPTLPAGCRRYLAVCGLGQSAPDAEATSPPPATAPIAADAAVDDHRDVSCPSKFQRPTAGTVVATSFPMRHNRVQQNITSSHGAIEWYV